MSSKPEQYDLLADESTSLSLMEDVLELLSSTDSKMPQAASNSERIMQQSPWLSRSAKHLPKLDLVDFALEM